MSMKEKSSSGRLGKAMGLLALMSYWRMQAVKREDGLKI